MFHLTEGVWGITVMLLAVLLLLAFWYWMHLTRTTTLFVGIDPRTDKAFVKRVRAKGGHIEHDDGEGAGVDVNIPHTFSYPTQTGGRVVVADLSTGDALKLAQEEGRDVFKRPTGAFLLRVRRDVRASQIAKSSADTWGWLSKYAGFIILLVLAILTAILFMVWHVIKNLPAGAVV